MDEQQLEQIEGVVEDIIYENEDNGYVVFEISGGGVLTVVCGIVGELHAGESVICRGRYENHATYGRQFHAQECETDMPKDLEAVYAFLASRSLPYIGARTADKIIDMFGAEALEVIANDPARLTKIPAHPHPGHLGGQGRPHPAGVQANVRNAGTHRLSGAV